MVSGAARFFPAAALSFLLTVSADAKNLPDYKVGDTVTETITAPVAFTVIDREQTDVIRRQTAEHAPTVFRHDPQAADDAVASFNNSFTQARTDFLDALHRRFSGKKPSELTVDALKTFLAEYTAAQHFPASRELQRSWIKGASGDALAALLATKLREAMTAYIRADHTAESFLTSEHAKILSHGTTVNVAQSQVQPLAHARENLARQFPVERAALGNFLAGYIRPNCELAADLTLAERERAAADVLAAERFDVGQTVVKSGEIITDRSKAALDELRALELHPATPAALIRQNWLMIAPGLVALGCFWFFLRREKSPAMPLAVTNDWQQRALEAERRAERATSLVRAELVAHLAKNLSSDLVKELVAQRKDLLDGHQMASAEMDALAERLEKLESGPSQDFYRQRIAELEAELAAKNAQNRALIQSKIDAARRQLEETRNRVTLN